MEKIEVLNGEDIYEKELVGMNVEGYFDYFESESCFCTLVLQKLQFINKIDKV